MSAAGCGLAGCGVVGSAVVGLFREEAHARGARLVSVAVRDRGKRRAADLRGLRLTTDALSLAADPEVSVVVEATGDVALGYALARECLRRGKAFVTASKSLMARHGLELEERAAQGGAELRYEAAAGGALPVVGLLRLGLSPGPVRGFDAVLNGTCNYVLSQMEKGHSFEAALASARRAGFAEADSGRDISGRDTADKVVLLARLCGVQLPLPEVETRGIEGLLPEDVAFGRRRGWALRLLGRFHDRGREVLADVAPSFVPAGSVLACAQDEENAVVLDGGEAGCVSLLGRGAGGAPTAAAILADVADVTEKRTRRVPRPARSARPTKDLSPARHYLRIEGVPAPKLSAVFRSAGVPLQALVITGAGPLRVVTAPIAPPALQEAVLALQGHVRAQVVLRLPDSAAAAPAASATSLIGERS